MNEEAIVIENYTSGYINPELKIYSYKDFKEHVNILGHISFKIIYVLYGILQFLAIWSCLAKNFHSDNLLIILTSLGLGFIPLLGSLFGMYGALIGWGWTLSHSIMIFFIIPYSIVNGPLLMIAFFDMYKDWRRWQSEEKNI